MMAITRTSMTWSIIPTTIGTRMTMTNMTRMTITTMTTMANVIQVSAKSAAIPKPNSMKFAWCWVVASRRWVTTTVTEFKYNLLSLSLKLILLYIFIPVSYSVTRRFGMMTATKSQPIVLPTVPTEWTVTTTTGDTRGTILWINGTHTPTILIPHHTHNLHGKVVTQNLQQNLYGVTVVTREQKGRKVIDGGRRGWRTRRKNQVQVLLRVLHHPKALNHQLRHLKVLHLPEALLHR